MISFGDGSFVRADAVRVRVGEMGLCSSTRSSGYATSASDGAGCKPADEGGGGIEEAKGFTLLSGLHQDSVTCVSQYVVVSLCAGLCFLVRRSMHDNDYRMPQRGTLTS
mgnify:CR=1 FL=1